MVKHIYDQGIGDLGVFILYKLRRLFLNIASMEI